MGKIATKECHECQIRRPANRMKQVTLSVISGSSGVGFSFNPQKKKSIRINSGKTFRRNVTKWECSVGAAHHVENYYELIAEQEKIKQEAKRLEDIKKQEAKRLEDIKKQEAKRLEDVIKKDKIKLDNLSNLNFSKYLVDGRAAATIEFINSTEYHALADEYDSVLKVYPENKCSESLRPATTLMSKKLTFGGAKIVSVGEAEIYKALRIEFYKNSAFFNAFIMFWVWNSIVVIILSFVIAFILESYNATNDFAGLSLVAGIAIFNIYRYKKKKKVSKIGLSVQPIILNLQSIMHKYHLERFVGFLKSSDENIEDVQYMLNKIKIANPQYEEIQVKPFPKDRASADDMSSRKAAEEKKQRLRLEKSQRELAAKERDRKSKESRDHEALVLAERGEQASAPQKPKAKSAPKNTAEELRQHSELENSKISTSDGSTRALARDMYEHDLFFDIACAKTAREMTLGDGSVSADEERALLTFLGEKNVEDKPLLDRILRARIPILVVLKMVKSKYVDDEFTLLDFLNNLFFIAESDGEVTEDELVFIGKAADLLGVSSKELDLIIKERLPEFTKTKSGGYILSENYDVLEDVLDEEDWEESDSGF
jgi:hypothetical protein